MDKMMPHNQTTALSGTITHVFAHRFTLQTQGETHLADLGPKGAEAFSLSPGLPVTLEGERRPSEIKVTRIEAALARRCSSSTRSRTILPAISTRIFRPT